MTDIAIKDMLSETIKVVDYDIWKGLFVPGVVEEPEEAKAALDSLVKIVKAHLPKCECTAGQYSATCPVVQHARVAKAVVQRMGL